MVPSKLDPYRWRRPPGSPIADAVDGRWTAARRVNHAPASGPEAYRFVTHPRRAPAAFECVLGLTTNIASGAVELGVIGHLVVYSSTWPMIWSPAELFVEILLWTPQNPVVTPSAIYRRWPSTARTRKLNVFRAWRRVELRWWIRARVRAEHSSRRDPVGLPSLSVALDTHAPARYRQPTDHVCRAGPPRRRTGRLGGRWRIRLPPDRRTVVPQIRNEEPLSIGADPKNRRRKIY